MNEGMVPMLKGHSQPAKHSGEHKVFLFQVNVTRDCNLRCTHCYIASEVKALSNRMTVSQVAKIVRDIGDFMMTAPHTHAEIHFVGGEPTMLGAKFFHRAMEEAHEIMKGYGTAFTWEFILITNLLSNEIMEIAPWFHKISTSYEPETRFPKKFHEDWWLRNVHALQERGLDVAITTCMTRPVIEHGAARLCDRIYSELGIKQMHFGFYIESGDGRKNAAAVTPSFAGTSQFLIDAATWYFERREGDPRLYVNPAESMLSAIHRNEPLDDIICPIISGSLDINDDGNAVSCIQAGGEIEVDWEGNVFSQSVADVISSKKFRKRVIEATRPQRACETCDEYRVCRSGCGVNFRKWDPEQDEDCPGYKRFIKHMRGLHEAGLRPRDAQYRARISF